MKIYLVNLDIYSDIHTTSQREPPDSFKYKAFDIVQSHADNRIYINLMDNVNNGWLELSNLTMHTSSNELILLSLEINDIQRLFERITHHPYIPLGNPYIPLGIRSPNLNMKLIQHTLNTAAKLLSDNETVENINQEWDKLIIGA